MLEPLYTADEVRRAEAQYAGFPDTAPELMERAGAAAATVALEEFGDARVWTVVCGRGSNGGDGRIVARHLQEAGRRGGGVDAEKGGRDLGEGGANVGAPFGTGLTRAPRGDARAPVP